MCNDQCICNLIKLIKMYYLHGITWYDQSEWWIEKSAEVTMAYFKACLPEAVEGNYKHFLPGLPLGQNLELECPVYEAWVLTTELLTSSTTCTYVRLIQHECLDADSFLVYVMVPFELWGSVTLRFYIYIFCRNWGKFQNFSQDCTFLGQESNMGSHR
jgi:hypothetical protein